MNLIKKFEHLFRQINNIKKINKRLTGKIKSCGIENSLPFIELKTGEKFFGYPAKYYQKRMFFLFKKDIKHKLKNHRECINILYDINFRYLIPETETEIYDVGKYYKFSEGDIVLEIGAYIGMYAIRIAQKVGITGKIIAIEAMKNNYKILKKNIHTNNIKNILPINKAIWHEQGMLQFYATTKQANSAVSDFVDNEKVINIESETIDSIVKNNNLSKIDFIRIQVNGAEKNALLGMDETFKLKPKLMVTVLHTDKSE
ncbi:MAG: FkbM family methyltransferase, partial [Bacteroidota bacterium]|nr:FkbM family methyltransferase [Bacteroidota bacterium]